MPPTDRIKISAAPREIGALIEGLPPSYRRIYNLAVDTRIPAEMVDGRWTILRSDLPAICAMLGLRLKDAAPPRTDRKASSALIAA